MVSYSTFHHLLCWSPIASRSCFSGNTTTPAAAAAWQVREAFTADVSRGNTLIVADYGQLELRVLAHMTGCESMKQAFRLGGDFHSRTALGMYDYIKAAVSEGVRATVGCCCEKYGSSEALKKV